MGQTYVTLTVMRDPMLPVDTRYSVFFDGVVGADGEAAEGAGGGLDMANPLTPSPTPFFPVATMKPGDGIGNDGLGEDGIGTKSELVGVGDGTGYDALGYDGLGVDWIAWSTQSINRVVRDGDYLFGIKFEDAIGNTAGGALKTYSVSIRTKPRAVQDLAIDSVATGVVNASWTASRDIEAA